MTSRPEPASATDTASAPEAFAADGPKGRGGPAELPEDLRRLSSPWQSPGLKGTLTTALRLYDFGHLCAIVIGIVLLVTVIDRLSALVRARLTA
ncbi:hypothetical protein [Nocardiopsis sp. M1B1]|uniref:hypothetical protein n=1 Tax=Nocardiopsis sp. M1B1 TaxID=3450454 RepID=UPI0040396C81